MKKVMSAIQVDCGYDRSSFLIYIENFPGEKRAHIRINEVRTQEEEKKELQELPPLQVDIPLSSWEQQEIVSVLGRDELEELHIQVEELEWQLKDKEKEIAKLKESPKKGGQQ